jgi:hypothetical protein
MVLRDRAAPTAQRQTVRPARSYMSRYVAPGSSAVALANGYPAAI